MKKLLIGLAAVAVLLIAAILIAPSFIDWNAHKQKITAMVRDATGRELTIRGNIDVTILPSPALRVEDVRLSSIAGAVSPEMVRLPEARITVAIGPLLEGRVATVVTLVRPTVNLEKLQDGRVNWDFGAAQEQSATGQPEVGKSGNGIPLDVKLDSFRIMNGAISYYDATTAMLERVENLNSEVSFDSLNGPFRINGKATVRGIPLALQASTGTIRPEAPLFVTAEVSTADGGATARLNGSITERDGGPAIEGELDVSAKSVGALLESTLSVAAPGVFAQPLTMRGSVVGSGKSLSLNAAEIEFGDARATGDLVVALGDIPQITGTIRTGNLNLDAFLDGGRRAGDTVVGATSARTNAAVPKTAVDPQAKNAGTQDFVLPANLDAAITVDADIIQYNGALVRDMALKASLKDGRGRIEGVSAILPGNSSFDLKGDVKPADGKTDLDLRLSGRSDNLREMLEWLGADISSVPADRLRRFSLSAAITGSPRHLTAKDINVQLDASKLSGGLALVLRERPAFGLRLVVDRVNIDAYLPHKDGPIQAVPGTAPAATVAQDATPPNPLGGMADTLRVLEHFDANIDATIKSLIVARTPATNIRADLTVLNGGLEIRHAGLDDFAGLRGSVKGKLDRSKELPSIDADYTVEIADQARFARFIDDPSLMRHQGKGRLASTGKLVGNLDRLVVNARIEGLGIIADVDGALTALLNAPAFKLAGSVRAPELVQMVRLAAENYSPAAGKLGPVDLSFQLEGSQTQIKAEAISGHAGPVTLRGSAALQLETPRPKLRAAISTSDVSLDLFLPLEERRRSDGAGSYRILPAAATATPAATSSRWSSDPIDLSVLDTFDAEVDVDMAVLAKDPYRFKDSKLRLRLDEGKLSLERFHANFSTGTVTVTGALAAEQRKIAGSFNANMDGVDASDLVEALRNYQVRLGPVRFGTKLRGPVTMTAALSTLGGSARELVAGLTGSGRITGQLRADMSSDTRQVSAVAGLAGSLLGNKVKEIRGITDAVQGTDLLISAFDGPATLNGDISVERGVAATRNLVLVGRGGRALTAGTANLPGWALDSVTDVTLGQDSDPYLTVQAAGALDDPYIRKLSGTLLRGTPVSTPAPEGQTVPKITAPPNTSQSAPADQKLKPEDVLKGLLQGFGR